MPNIALQNAIINQQGQERRYFVPNVVKIYTKQLRLLRDLRAVNIFAENLVKRNGEMEFLAGINIQIGKGEILHTEIY